MTTAEETQRVRDEKISELHDKLIGAVERLVTGDNWAEALRFAAHFRSRSFNNVLLIWQQHMAAFETDRVPEPYPSYVAGYRQLQQLGRQVDKGQHGYQILPPVTNRFASSNSSDPASWCRLQRVEKPKPGEVARSKMVGVQSPYVRDVSQTSGDPLPERPAPALLQGEAPSGLWLRLAAQVPEAGFELFHVDHEGMIHGANGLTDIEARTVTVRSNMDEAAQVKTLAHELGHVLMHGPDQHEARQPRGIGEVEAESVALMIGAAHGMDTSGYTIPYIAGCAANVDGQDPIEIVKATANVCARRRCRSSRSSIRHGCRAALPRGRSTSRSSASERCVNTRSPRTGAIRSRLHVSPWGGACDVCPGCLLRGDGDDSAADAPASGGDGARARRRAGVPVPARRQRPLTRHGLHDATAVLLQIDSRWRDHPGADISLPTGAASGVIVVDVDVHGKTDGDRAFEVAKQEGLLEDWQLMVRSPSGGLHVHFPAGEIEQRSWQAASAGVDFRGDGGYIIVPSSSRMVDGQWLSYAVRSLAQDAGRPVDAQWLRDFLDPRPEPVAREIADHPFEDLDVSRIAAWVTRLHEGERNHGVFWAACNLAEHGVGAQDALDVLAGAAGRTGLSEREAATTVRSAYRRVTGGVPISTSAGLGPRLPPSAELSRSLS